MKSLIKVFATTAVLAATLMMPALAAADNVSFSYQGMIKANNQAYTGPGYLKLAILNNEKTSVLWSNDGTVGLGSNPNNLPTPAGSVQVNVTDGVFSIQVGDEAVPNMTPLDNAVLVSDKTLRLRIWFSTDGINFEQLNPDQKLADLTLASIQTGKNDYVIYVNGAAGNDANNGLTTETAKKTISGAVDILPDKVRCNITVSIAPGTYREMVLPDGISVQYGKTLAFVGDKSWTPSSAGTPSVIIDGADSGNTAVRDYAFYARQCSDLKVQGITFQNAKINQAKFENGSYTVERCLARKSAVAGFNIGCGFFGGPQSYLNFNECKATENANDGFTVSSSSRAYLTTCTATYNGRGVFVTANSIGQFFGYNYIAYNAVGVQSNSNSDMGCNPGTSPSNRTHIENNTSFGAVVNWGGFFTPYDAIFLNNAQNFQNFRGDIVQ